MWVWNFAQIYRTTARKYEKTSSRSAFHYPIFVNNTQYQTNGYDKYCVRQSLRQVYMKK